MLALFYQMKTAQIKPVLQIDEHYKLLLNQKSLKTSDTLSKCRVCLSESLTRPIYSDDHKTEIVEALQIFGDIRISEDDNYPKHLCSACFKFIKGAILFRKVAKQSEAQLQLLLKQEVQLEPGYCDEGDDDDTFEVKETQKWSEDELDTLNGSKIKKKLKKVKYTPKVTCHVCNKVLNKSYYKEHMTMHDPDHKKYVCDVCGKSFRLRCAYHNHSLRHREGFPYKCQFCPYKGRYAELLKTHMRTHTGDYRYMCTECPARFLFKSNLNSHMLKHKEPQFKCDACKRAFHSKLMLQRHYEADHLGIKNHVCNICGKAFGYRNAMMKHQRHVHKREKMLYGRIPSYLEAEHKNQENIE